MKDWVTYIDEFDKVKAWDISFMTVPQIHEVEETIREVGFRIVGNIAARKMADAISYTEQVLL